MEGTVLSSHTVTVIKAMMTYVVPFCEGIQERDEFSLRSFFDALHSHGDK